MYVVLWRLRSRSHNGPAISAQVFPPILEGLVAPSPEDPEGLGHQPAVAVEVGVAEPAAGEPPRLEGDGQLEVQLGAAAVPDAGDAPRVRDAELERVAEPHGQRLQASCQLSHVKCQEEYVSSPVKTGQRCPLVVVSSVVCGVA